MRIASVLLHRRRTSRLLGSLPVGNKHTRTHTTEHRKKTHGRTRNGRAQLRCDSRVALKLLVCAQECMTNALAHGCIRRFCCGVDYTLNDWHLRVRHVVVRQVVACSVTSGRVADAGGWFDVDVEGKPSHFGLELSRLSLGLQTSLA